MKATGRAARPPYGSVQKFVINNIFPITVFITGACVLAIEVVATRILSPYYGNTIYTVSSVISVILAALSVGYYTGGTFADKRPSTKYFFGIIMLSGIGVLLFHALGFIALPLISANMPITSGALVSSIVLFFLPALLLGMLSPFAVKLQSVHFPKQGLGTIAGTMFFWSTLGSILGSLAAGFVLIPHFGINEIMIGSGVLLFVLGLVPLIVLGASKNRLRKPVLVFLLSLGLATLFSMMPGSGRTVYSKDGIYEKIIIRDTKQDKKRGNRPVRFFKQDRSSSGAMFLDTNDPRDLAYEYSKYYSLYKIFKPEVKNALVIGGGAYSIPKVLLADLPEATIDVSEIEPSLYDLAKHYFKLQDSPRLHNYTDDGRRLLKEAKQPYDMIFSDVYYSYYSIPAHFTTQEFFQTAKDKLTPDGIFIANLIGELTREKPSLTMSEIRTFQTIFPNSYIFATVSPKTTTVQNLILVGYNSDKKVDLSASALAHYPEPVLQSLPEKLVDTKRFELSPYPILTDNFSPVDHLTTYLLKRSVSKQNAPDSSEMLALIEQQLRYGSRSLRAPGHQAVQEFLKAELQITTDHVITQDWQHKAADGASYDLQNIIGRIRPEQKRRIVLGSHYDTKRLADKDSEHVDQPVPGANDGASGVAVLLEIARTLSHRAPDIGVDIVLFDGEEGEETQSSDHNDWQPLGSTYFAANLSNLYGDTKPESGIVLDMVCDKNLNIKKEPSSIQSANLQLETFWKIGQRESRHVFQDTKLSIIISDDHTALNKAGIPSFVVIDLDYPYFHTTRDTLDKCSAKSLETVAKTTLTYIYESGK